MQTNDTILDALDYIPSDVVCASDYEQLAPRFISADRFAYISGGSAHDITLQNNRNAFSGFSITPRLSRNVNSSDTAVEIIGRQLQHPALLAPVAYQALVHPQGELATAYAAASTDTGLIASTLSSHRLEAIAENAGRERWFQLYRQPKDSDTQRLIDRAVNAGYKSIVVTIDAAVQAPSIRAVRAGFTFPESIVPANLVDQQLVNPVAVARGKSRIFQSYGENATSFEHIKQLIEYSTIPVLVKGVLHPDDAIALKDLGAAGVIVSNHGGRTLDGAPASLAVLPQIRAAVGPDYLVLFDSGVRSGSDIFKAIAQGADAVLIGRLQLYALSVAGALGVAHMLKLLREELELCMAMSACTSIADIKATILHTN